MNNTKLNPLRITSLVQIQTHRVMLLDRFVEKTFHVSMRTDGVTNVTRQTILGSQFDRFEPRNILSIEEHLHNRGIILVYTRGISGQYDTFQNHTIGIDTSSVHHERSASHKLVRLLIKHQKR